MKLVGDKLEQWALVQTDKSAKDLFGRSAFNRYYYASFLLTREMLGEFNISWRGHSHSGIPEILRKPLKKQVSKHLDMSVRNGMLSNSQRSQIMKTHNQSLNELASLLEEAYQVRRIADYEPEIPINQLNKIISLENHKLSTAKRWPEKVSAYCKSIRKAWRDAGIA